MEEQLTRLKARLPEIADGSQDALLSYLLEVAAAQAAAWLGRPSVPEACESAVVRLAAIAFHRLGMEGESSHTEGGVSAVVDMLPEDIKALLRPYRLAKVGD